PASPSIHGDSSGSHSPREVDSISGDA
ncbi:hypothetical protein EE612_034030, partial [Oryza sativa]